MHTLNCYMALIGGTPGGDFQAQCGLQILTNLLDFGIAPQEAVEAPRWWSFPGTDPASLGTPAELRTEPEKPEDTLKALERMGHKVARRRPGIHDGKTQFMPILGPVTMLGAYPGASRLE